MTAGWVLVSVWVAVTLLGGTFRRHLLRRTRQAKAAPAPPLAPLASLPIPIPERDSENTRFLRTGNVWWVSCDDMITLLDDLDVGSQPATAWVGAIRQQLAESVLTFDLRRAERTGRTP